MAVDTRHKRMSMLNFGDGTNIHVLFEADAGAVELDDRAHLLDLYSGIALASPSAVTADGALLIKYGVNDPTGYRSYTSGQPQRYGIKLLEVMKWLRVTSTVAVARLLIL